jgi:Cu2+-exporting ATPase
MTGAAIPSGIGCPACSAAPEPPMPVHQPDASGALRRIDISLPSIHCAGCISGVENGLLAEPGVASARVNLTLKRATVTVQDTPGAEARLISALDRLGYEARPLDSAALEATRSDAKGRDLLARIAVAGFALMNVMLLSIAVWSGAIDTTRDLMHWISAAIAIPAVAYAAQPFFHNAWKALSAGRLDMDVPISTAILLALGVSFWETMHSGENAFFDAALMLTFFLLIGRYLSHLTRASARSAAAELAALEVHMAERVLQDGTRETIPLDALAPGDILAVPAGTRVPADGTVTQGRSEIDPSLLTGETMPQAVASGDMVRAGMMNISGPLLIRADSLGEDTLLCQITRLVEAAEQSRSKFASVASRASQFYSHTVNILALTAFFGWGLTTGDWRLAINIAAAVLIITCPCALGLAVPAVLTAASGRLFRMGVLLKDGDAFERLAGIDSVVFDKTGTLTTGQPVLDNAGSLQPQSFAIAAALAAGSAHPLSRAITQAASDAGVEPSRLENITEHPGLGTHATLDNQPVRLGRAEWLGATGPQDRTAAWLKIGNGAPQPLIFTDELRPEAAATITRLQSAGLPVSLLSGDAEAPVRAMAERLGITDWKARATPVQKVEYLQAMKNAGKHPLMAGDGLNDAAALAAAHVSISPASAIDASRSAADLIIISNRIDRIADAWELSRTARTRILENFAMAFAYNIITVPVAFAGFVTPLIAAIAMSCSSIIVALNAMRLGRRA